VAYLVEADFSGIEAVLTGWFSGDPDYIKVAKLGVHAYLTSYTMKMPADPNWPAERLAEHFAMLKAEHPREYDVNKHGVHMSNYGASAYAMHEMFPDDFPTIASAQMWQEFYFDTCPLLAPWHAHTRETAERQHFLGGPGAHPFGYKHWFFNVLTYVPVRGIAPRGAQVVNRGGRNFILKLGEDAKRCIAFYPQSTAAAIIKEAMLRLFKPGSPSYIGDAFHELAPWCPGHDDPEADPRSICTPLRAQVHDSLVLEVPFRQMDRVLHFLVLEMTRPIPELPCPVEWGLGEHLAIGVEVKAGKNWLPFNGDATKGPINLLGMQKVKLESLQVPTLAGDAPIPVDYDDEELELLEGEPEETKELNA